MLVNGAEVLDFLPKLGIDEVKGIYELFKSKERNKKDLDHVRCVKDEIKGSWIPFKRSDQR